MGQESHSLCTVSLIASTVKAIDMNKAKISSVFLEDRAKSDH